MNEVDKQFLRIYGCFNHWIDLKLFHTSKILDLILYLIKFNQIYLFYSEEYHQFFPPFSAVSDSTQRWGSNTAIPKLILLILHKRDPEFRQLQTSVKWIMVKISILHCRDELSTLMIPKILLFPTYFNVHKHDSIFCDTQYWLWT